jgi:arsenate reductase
MLRMSQGAEMNSAEAKKLSILFMCVANSARSQLAEGLARKMFPDAVIQSAGSHPGKLNPFAVTVMKEIGLDISKHYSKSVDELSPRFLVELNYVITLCAEEVCPVLVSKAKKLHWPHPDPVTKEPLLDAEALKRFREARDSISKKLEAFKSEVEK